MPAEAPALADRAIGVLEQADEDFFATRPDVLGTVLLAAAID